MLDFRFVMYLFATLTCFGCSQVKQESEVEEVVSENIWGVFSTCQLKLDYYHTSGYSTFDRYWYEIIITDSILTLYFESPENDDWKFISYAKRRKLSVEELESIKELITSAQVSQKSEGHADRIGSGYGEQRLILDFNDISINGSTGYSSLRSDKDTSSYQSYIEAQKIENTTLKGDYELLFSKLEYLFPDMDSLMTEKNKKF